MRAPLPLALALAASSACESSPSPMAIEPAEVLWTRAIGERSSGPVVVAGRLLLAEDDTLKALDPLTGGEIWSVDLGSGESIAIPALTARGDVAYGFYGRIVAIGVADGAILWSMPAPSPGIPAADAERLYLIRPGSIAALDPGSGAILWESPVSASFGVTAVGGGVVCVASASVSCYDGADGRLLWSALSPDESLVVDLDIGTGRAVASTLSGMLAAYDPRTGTIVWRRTLASAIQGTAVAGTHVYSCLRGEDLDEAGSCVALEASNGEVRWTIATRGPVSAPLVREGTLIVIDARAILQLEAATGQLIRRVAPPREGFHVAHLAYIGGVLHARLFGELLAVRLR